ncbi:hypothetical protein B0T25DRAFT_140264 [Lasiosphaeria hispida]|uniref:G domain-containing protein n=1 Tax=Lasiosphaeria hispida TaxID=260671 RepID=A0AAJ0HL43_9PEZI|nr:hypothetical protein B0T25DRAFT_140264 [Lasiosphaeria hispida]
MVVWDEDQLDKWDKILDRQVNKLSGLLNAQTYYRAHRDRASTRTRVQDNGQRSQPTERTIFTPDPSDAEMDLDFDSQSDIQAKAEGDITTLAALQGPVADEKMQSMTRRRDVAQRAMDSLNLRAGSLVEGHPGMKFRILLMGKQGNGKTTLCQRVLGIDLEGSDSIFGNSTDFENVKKEQAFAGRNPDLIIHDSGGFENGSDSATKALQDFLDERHRDATDISQRIHCIWYVIACNSSKPIYPIDEQFLRNQFRVARIPILIVLTKYDDIIDKVKKVTGSMSKEVEKKAYNEFDKRTLTPIRALVEEAKGVHGMNVEICTVGLRQGEDEFMPQLFKPDGLHNFGSVQMVSLMKKKLALELRPLLAAIQVADPKNKLAEAVDACIKLYWRAIVVKSIPILPFLTVGSLATVYALTLKKAQRIWKIETEPGIRISPLEGELTSLIIKAIFNNKSGTGVAFLSAVRLVDISGLLAASKMARDLVTIVVGLNAILYGFWRIQHRSGPKAIPLSWDQPQKACRDFQTSMRRGQMMREIDAINFANMYRQKDVNSIADRAWPASIGEVVPTLRRTERQRREEMGQYDAVNPV